MVVNLMELDGAMAQFVEIRTIPTGTEAKICAPCFSVGP